MQGRLYRSRVDRVVAGVCGGLARYTGIHPTIIRLFFVILALGQGVGILLYMLLWAILPYPDQTVMDAGPVEIAGMANRMAGDLRSVVRPPAAQLGLVVGGGLVIVGLYYLVRNLGLIPFWLDFDLFWPMLLVVGGLVLVFRWLGGSLRGG